MRCNQVSIFIERFGKYVPKDYPAGVQRISVYCDDFHSIYAALSKAYATAVNELNEYESIGARTDVSTNEFSYKDYTKMHGTVPKQRSYDIDDNPLYANRRLDLLRDYVWVYEHSAEVMEVIRNSRKEDVVPALRERFALDDMQVRKLLQIRLDLLDRDSFEQIRQEIEDLERRQGEIRDGAQTAQGTDMRLYWRKRIRECESGIDEIRAYFTAADHYEDIVRAMRDSQEPEEYMKYMEKTYGFSREQARAIRYAPADRYSRPERIRQEEKLKRLEKNVQNYREWLARAEEA